MVLHELGLVEHEHLPVESCEVLEVEAEQRIGGDHDPGAGHLVCEFRATSCSCGANRAHTDIGCELCRLAVPVLDHAGGCNDQETRIGGPLEHVQEQCQGLDGLAEAHVVREDAAELVAVEKGEPVEALALVVPQRGGQPRRWLDRLGLAQVAHARHA